MQALTGDYRPEHVFALKQSLAACRYYQGLMTACDLEIEQQLKGFDARVDVTAKPLAPPKVRRRKLFSNEPSFDLRSHLYRIFGVDLTAVPGISVLTAHTILSEIGPDVSKFRNAAAFASWLGLCPHNDISGGKVLSVKTRRVKNRVAVAFRMAANALFRSQSPLGDFFRRMRAKLGAPQAITAAAHKLAASFITCYPPAKPTIRPFHTAISNNCASAPKPASEPRQRHSDSLLYRPRHLRHPEPGAFRRWWKCSSGDEPGRGI